MADEPDSSSLEGLSWNVEKTLYRFFVTWPDDDDICCPDAERLQVAVSTVASHFTCLSCGVEWDAEVEIAEIVM